MPLSDLSVGYCRSCSCCTDTATGAKTELSNATFRLLGSTKHISDTSRSCWWMRRLPAVRLGLWMLALGAHQAFHWISYAVQTRKHRPLPCSRRERKSVQSFFCNTEAACILFSECSFHCRPGHQALLSVAQWSSNPLLTTPCSVNFVQFQSEVLFPEKKKINNKNLFIAMCLWKTEQNLVRFFVLCLLCVGMRCVWSKQNLCKIKHGKFFSSLFVLPSLLLYWKQMRAMRTLALPQYFSYTDC